MKSLLSTAASRAWLGVALAGFVVVVLVLALMLIPRLSAGQQVVDAAKPAFSDARVAGTRAGIDVVSDYTDVVDPLLTRDGGGPRDVERLIGYMRRKLGLTAAQVRKILRREAPHVEALTRALPLNGVADEVPVLTSYLATTMTLSEEQLGAALEQDFPHISQALTALRNTSDAWTDVPGIDGLTRLRGDKPVRTIPGLRKYYRDDVVPLMVEHGGDVRDLAGSGGIGYIPKLLLVIGLALLALGVRGARRAAASANDVPGKLAWKVIGAVGVLLLAVVVLGQYFPRLGGAQKTVTDFAPVFAKDRVRGAANGADALHDAIAFGDPLMTARSGAAAEVPGLYRFVAQRIGLTTKEVKAAIARRAPQTVALLDALPLTDAARELPRLHSYLERALRLKGDELDDLLQARVPALNQALLKLPDVTAAWEAIPGSAKMTRFDGFVPVRSVTDFDDYLRQDLVPVLTGQREHFDSLAGRWPPLDAFAPALLLLALGLILYAGVMMQFVARRS